MAVQKIRRRSSWVDLAGACLLFCGLRARCLPNSESERDDDGDGDGRDGRMDGWMEMDSYVVSVWICRGTQ
ncbi:hypothetical protein BKA81DRAFT_374638 [Phyllosticta paracitricarpa]|uniref:Secreted protein n=1 Tax=Phyllosticta citricarpa TaxID=55181 RepID=A0ABR1MMU9_9PEZI